MTTIEFLTAAGSRIPIPTDDLESELGAVLQGQHLRRDHPSYDDTRALWNAMIDRRPALIVRCANADDARCCVRFAAARNLAVTVRGGGHNIGGRAVADDALLIDFSGMRRVRVNAVQQVADVSPGALLGDIDLATAPHALVLPTGIVSQTGVAGLMLGGGFGWLSRRYGLTCDHLIAADVVTGAGEAIHANEHSHGDLLWALRGGGGGFGIVTSFRFRLRRLQPTVVAGPIVRIDDGPAAAMLRFRTCTATAPAELTCMLKLCAAPPAPFLPAAVHGRPAGITIVCHSGEGESAVHDLAELRRAPAPTADLVQRRPFAEFQAMFDAGEPKGRRDYWKSEYIGELDDETTRILLAASERLPSPHANIKVFHLGEAVTRVPAATSAASHRDARFIVVIAAAWEQRAEDDRNIAWVRGTWQQVHARSGRGGYINFLTEDTSAAELAQAHGGVDPQRLAAVRHLYDPAGLLRGA